MREGWKYPAAAIRMCIASLRLGQYPHLITASTFTKRQVLPVYRNAPIASPQFYLQNTNYEIIVWT